MSRSGSDNRQRETTLSARFNNQEAEAIRDMADRAGTSVASVIRGAVLKTQLRGTRRPTVNHEMDARILGELGRIAQEKILGIPARLKRIAEHMETRSKAKTFSFEVVFSREFAME